MLNRSPWVRTAVLAVVACLTASVAGCGRQPGPAGTTTLTVADFYSMKHSIGVAGIQPFMKHARQVSGGRIGFDYRPSEQLAAAADIHHAVRVDAADIGNILYIDSQMPLLYVTQLPGLYRDDQVVAASRAFWTFVRTDPAMVGAFRSWNMHPLFCFTTTNYQFQFSDRSVDSVDKLAGKQVRVAGSVLPLSVLAAGASPVDLSASEAYDAFNRGVVDGISLSVTSMKDYAFYELIHSTIIDVDLGGFPVCYAMNLDRWRGLAPEDQRALTAAGDAAVTETATRLRDQVGQDLERWRRAGIDIHRARPDPARTARLARVEAEWVDQVVGHGMDRRTVESAIADWRRLLRAEVSR